MKSYKERNCSHRKQTRGYLGMRVMNTFPIRTVVMVTQLYAFVILSGKPRERGGREIVLSRKLGCLYSLKELDWNQPRNTQSFPGISSCGDTSQGIHESSPKPTTHGGVSVCISVCLYICECLNVCAYVYWCTCVYLYVCLSTYLCVYGHVRVSMSMYVFMCVSLCLYG